MKTNRRAQRRERSKKIGAKGGSKARDRKARRIITQADARKAAERHVSKRMFQGATVIDGVDARLGIYLRPGLKPEDLWVVYKNSDGPPALKSSDIVIVSKRTGRVIYEGSAGDEG